MRTTAALLITLAMLGPSWALARDLTEILQSPHRPVMSEALAVLPQIPELSDIRAGDSDSRMDVERWLPRLLSNGPKMIATFESVYPGATWVFLGRDGLPWADLFEAFYTSIGQPDRVVRLGISKPSMASVTDDTLVAMMLSHGLPVDRLDSSQPVVFIDSVSSGSGRQGRRLMGAVYSDWINRGKDPLLIVNKIDMIGMIVSTFSGTVNDLHFKVFHHYLQALLFLPPNDRIRPEELQNNLRVLTYPEQRNEANEAGYTHFMGAWHDSFGTIRRFSDGRVAADPGAPFGMVMKKTVLWTQKKIWEFVQSGDCAAQVERHASSLEFGFPWRRPAAYQPNANAVRAWREQVTRRQGLASGGDWQGALDLAAALTEQAAAPKDRFSLVQAAGSQVRKIQELSWFDYARPGTTLSDIQSLQTALNSGGCVKALGTQK